MLHTEYRIEFNKIKEKWMEQAITERAKKEISKTALCLSELELGRRLRETTEAKLLLEKAGNPPLISLTGVAEQIKIAEKGGLLSPKELEAVGTVLTGIRRLRDYLSRCRQYETGLAYYDENLDVMEEVREQISLQIRAGQVDDHASRELKNVRENIERTETRMREKADSILRNNKKYMSDFFSTIRNGHICLPVKKDCKMQIPGSVMDQSSTGSTLFIEPASIVKYYDELQLLRIREENEERRILYSLTAMVADAADGMEENIRIIEKLDFIFSKGKFSIEYGGTEPEINTERQIVIKNGRHPLMDPNINVPLNFELGNGINGVVVTGPNTGGKTVAIKTVALTCMMAQCGLHVACEEAKICMNNAILCDIGDGQDLSENLSTFSAHITNVLDILEHVTGESLVIMDELGSGTDPAEGMGIAVAILEELRKSGALFLVTTHYPEVKVFAEQTEGIVNARMTFDKESLKPLYRLVIGEAGESCAFHIAGRLGMPEHMLQRAVKAAYGDEGVPFIKTEQKENTVVKPKLQKKRQTVRQTEAEKFRLGDSVMVLQDKKIGIVCQKANEKGVLRVQLSDKKIWINHKRIKLLVAADQLYPEDYDFSIIFDSVEKRKKQHDMERKYVEDLLEYEE